MRKALTTNIILLEQILRFAQNDKTAFVRFLLR